ncbi:hypothetical protein [Propionibacterium sp.]|uniref:hypothetical protein n=1 Tax=Propionibacterium sp. TaxID=1977903 RepID=UPI00345EB9B7
MEGDRPTGGPAVSPVDVSPSATFVAAKDPSARGPLSVLLFAVVAAGLVPASLVAATAGGPGGTQIGQLLAMMVAGLRFAWILGSPARHIYELMIWVFVYVFLGMAPFVQLRLGVEPETVVNIRLEYEPTAALIVLTGCAAILIGSHLARNHWPTPGAARRPDAGRAQVLAVVGLVLGAYYVSQLGVRNIALPRLAMSELRREVWPEPAVATLTYGFVTMSLFVAALALIKLRLEDQHEVSHIRILEWATLGMLFLIVNPVSTPRYIFGSVALAVLAVYGLYSTVRKFRIVAVATLIGMVVIFPAADAFRYSLDAGIILEDPLQELTGPDYDGFAQIVNTVQYADLEGHTGGRQMLGALLYWVPRSVWPDKPQDTGEMLGEYKEYIFTNISSPLWAEFFIDFGWVGLMAGMLLVGYWARRLDIQAEAQLRERRSPDLINCILPFYSLIILRGSLLQSLAYISVAFVLILFVQRRRT